MFLLRLCSGPAALILWGSAEALMMLTSGIPGIYCMEPSNKKVCKGPLPASSAIRYG